VLCRRKLSTIFAKFLHVYLKVYEIDIRNPVWGFIYPLWGCIPPIQSRWSMRGAIYITVNATTDCSLGLLTLESLPVQNSRLRTHTEGLSSGL